MLTIARSESDYLRGAEERSHELNGASLILERHATSSISSDNPRNSYSRRSAPRWASSSQFLTFFSVHNDLLFPVHARPIGREPRQISGWLGRVELLSLREEEQRVTQGDSDGIYEAHDDGVTNVVLVARVVQAANAVISLEPHTSVVERVARKRGEYRRRGSGKADVHERQNEAYTVHAQGAGGDLFVRHHSRPGKLLRKAALVLVPLIAEEIDNPDDQNRNHQDEGHEGRAQQEIVQGDTTDAPDVKYFYEAATSVASRMKIGVDELELRSDESGLSV